MGVVKARSFKAICADVLKNVKLVLLRNALLLLISRFDRSIVALVTVTRDSWVIFPSGVWNMVLVKVEKEPSVVIHPLLLRSVLFMNAEFDVAIVMAKLLVPSVVIVLFSKVLLFALVVSWMPLLLLLPCVVMVFPEIVLSLLLLVMRRIPVLPLCCFGYCYCLSFLVDGYPYCRCCFLVC